MILDAGGASCQRSRVHFTRDLLATVPHGAHEPVAALRTIVAQPDYGSGLVQLPKLEKGLRSRFAQMAALLAGAILAKLDGTQDRMNQHHLIRDDEPDRSLLRSTLGVTACLAFAGTLLALSEVVLRLVGFRYDAPNPIVIWNRLEDRRIAAGEGMYRFHPYWFWEPRPGAEVDGCPGERINRAGYRGPERPRASERGTLRIVVLGDSSTFGMGICGDKVYPAVLERELPASEVLNFGVIGFSAFQGEKLLAGRALDYRPQVILAAFGAIDELLPGLPYDVDTKFGITSRTPPWAIRSRDRLRRLRIFQLLERAISPGGEDPKPAGVNWGKWNRGDPDYVRNQSLASFERSLETIVSLGRSHGARVVLIAPPRRTVVETRWPWVEEYSAAVCRVASRMGAPCWDARAAFRAVPNNDGGLFLDDYHPNVAGHELYGKFLAENIRRLLSLGAETKDGATSTGE
jgi:hypothetical protein